ncbi:cytochrome P450 [Nocardia sp. 2YAB30]|uniref:cytochrome P450 n=1 Tax=unclassified Nocardia TaxID=2637762 RepID=UPI003F9EA585
MDTSSAQTGRQECGWMSLLRAPETRPLPRCWWYDDSTLVIVDAALAEEVLRAPRGTYILPSRFYVDTADGSGGGRTSTELPPGRATVQSWMTPAWTAASVRKLAPAMVAAADEALDAHPPTATGWPALEGALELSSRLAALLCLGPDADLVTGLHTTMRAAAPGVVRGVGRPDDPDAKARFAQAAAEIGSRVQRAVDRRRGGVDVDSPDLLSTLLTAAHKRGHTDLRSVVFAVAHALWRVETGPGLVTAWMLHELAKHPDHQTRLRQEALAVLGSSGTPEALNPTDLISTGHAMHETLRLYPTAWIQGWVACQAVDIGDQHLEPGMQVRIAVYPIQRDPANYLDPNAFRPQRWADPDLAGPANAFLPFSLGTSYCKGTHWVHAVATLSTAAVLRRYRLVPARGAQVIEQFTSHLQPIGLSLDTIQLPISN